MNRLRHDAGKLLTNEFRPAFAFDGRPSTSSDARREFVLGKGKRYR
jgi:hypothetical protein